MGVRIKYKILTIFRLNENYIIIYPCDVEIDNPKDSKIKIRVSFYGYICKELSVMSQIKHKCFKAIHVPEHPIKAKEADHTSYINVSTNMGKHLSIL